MNFNRRNKLNNNNNRISFSKIKSVLEAPDLLGIQTDSFEDFVQLQTPPSKRENKGLQQVFIGNFPIFDNKENYRLDFLEYYVEKPRYSIVECLERGLTFATPLKAKLRLSTKDPETEEFVNTVEQEVYLGNLPYMTDQATFIINGAERVVVSQLHRSPGVAFSQTVHPNGTPIYSARIIPLRGSWVEFATDINHVMFVYIDRRKKFPATTLLRALDYASDEQILGLFDLVEDIDVNRVKLDKYLGRTIASDVFDTSTGEIFLTKDSVLSEKDLERIKETEVDKIKLVKTDGLVEQDLILNTLRKDTARTKEEALLSIYRQLRSGEAPDTETARLLIEKLFFNDKRYDLGEVGRHRMNDKLKLQIPENITVLTPQDIIEIMRHIIKLKAGDESMDDIDHLGNRRIRTVGEQLAQQFNIGMARMARTIKERMNMRDTESFTPQDLVNARTISSVVNAFFG
ncbi:MAG TPA: DNA-directed RNA polymerase subunit beta, partial [Ignavibacteriales bacterium]|nr:DNA-directed RNA polymerase subunit beta [Ignavibacteriales bacterium]